MNIIDDYELNVLDLCRIKPLLRQISLNSLSPKFFLSSVYPTKTSYEIVQRHNKEIRRTIRKFYKSDIKMIFFLEKHLDPDTSYFLGWHRHVLIEDASEDRWNKLTKQMSSFILDHHPEIYFQLNDGNEIDDKSKIELLISVLGQIPFMNNEEGGIDVRPIHHLEKLLAYCSKQFEWILPSYEIIDPVSSDIDITFFLMHKQDGIDWKTREAKVSAGFNRSLR